MDRSSSERFDWQREDISDTSLGLDDAGRAGIGLELAPQPQDLDVDAPIADIFVDPGCLQQLLTRERPLRRLDEREQEGIFALCQRNRGSAWIHKAPTTASELPSIESISTPLRIADPRCAPHFLSSQDGPDAREQFPETERFGDAVVCAKLEADDTVGFITSLTGHNDNRDVRVGSNFSQEIESAILTEPQVQNDQAGVDHCKAAPQFALGGRCTSRHIVTLKITDDRAPHCRVVIDNKDMTHFSDLTAHPAAFLRHVAAALCTSGDRASWYGRYRCSGSPHLY